MEGWFLFLWLDWMLAFLLWDEARPVAYFNLALPFLLVLYLALFQWWPIVPKVISWLF